MIDVHPGGQISRPVPALWFSDIVPPADWLLPALLYEEQIVVFGLERPPPWLERRAATLRELQREAGSDLVSSHRIQSDEISARTFEVLDNSLQWLALRHAGQASAMGRWADVVLDSSDDRRSGIDNESERRTRTRRRHTNRLDPLDPELQGRLSLEKVGYAIESWLKRHGGATGIGSTIVLPTEVANVVLATLGDEIGRLHGWRPAGRSLPSPSGTTDPTQLLPAFEVLGLPIPETGTRLTDVLALRSDLSEELAEVRMLLDQTLRAASVDRGAMSLDVCTDRLRAGFAPLLSDIERAMELRRLRSVRVQLRLAFSKPGQQITALLSGMGVAAAAGVRTLDATGVVEAVTSCANPRELVIGAGLSLATAVVRSACSSIRFARAEAEIGSSPFWAIYEAPGLTTAR